jgi:hypothetical protein
MARWSVREAGALQGKRLIGMKRMQRKITLSYLRCQQVRGCSLLSPASVAAERLIV